MYREVDTEGVRELACATITIFTAVANSVSSEWAFSAMDLIHSKLTNKLGAEKANKRIFISMNNHALGKNGSNIIGDPMVKTAEEQVEVETHLLEILADDGYKLDEDETLEDTSDLL